MDVEPEEQQNGATRSKAHAPSPLIENKSNLSDDTEKEEVKRVTEGESDDEARSYTSTIGSSTKPPSISKQPKDLV